VLLVIAGIALLGYVGFEYGSMYTSQRHLQQAWQQQQGARPQNASAAQPPDEDLTRLSIPKIKLDAVVVEGTAYKQLAIAPGHLKDTPAPGDDGNSVISAHRDTFFRHIYELQKGDTVQVQRRGKIFTYEVTGKKIVEPDDVSVLHKTTDPQLTLLTCYPTYYIGPAPERLAVFSKLVSAQPAGGAGGTQPVSVTTSH
jgi:sortase A